MTQVLLWTGKGALLLLAGALLVLLLALVVPAALTLRYEAGAFAVKAQVLGLSFRLWPPKPRTAAQEQKARQRAEAKRAKKEAKRKAKRERQAAREEKKRKKSVAGSPSGASAPRKGEEKAPPAPGAAGPKKKEPPLAERLRRGLYRLGRVTEEAGWLAKKILGSLRVKHIQVYLPVTGDTAADTAILYGQLWAGLSAALGVLQRGLRLQFDRLELAPDYVGLYKGREVLSCKIQAQLIIMVVAGIYVFIRLWRDKVF